MAQKVFTIGKGDTAVSLRMTLEDSRDPADWSLVDVRFSMRNVRTGLLKINRAAAAIVDGNARVVEYAFTLADVDTPGRYRAEFVNIEDAGPPAIEQTYPNHERNALFVEVGDTVDDL